MEVTEQELYTPNYKVVRWVLLLGVLCGLSSVAVGWPAMVFIFEQSVEAYSYLPGIEPPWIATLGLYLPSSIHPWALGLSLTFHLFLMLFIGLLLVLILRPADGKAALLLGSTTAVVAGTTALVFGLGWAMFLAEGAVPSIPDLEKMAKAVTFLDQEVQVLDENTTRETLLSSFPYLDEHEPEVKGDKLLGKILADLVMGGAEASFVGIPLVIGTFVLVILFSTLIADFVFHETGRLGPAFCLTYAEITILSWPLLGFMLTTLSMQYFDPNQQMPPESLIGVAVSIILTWIAFSGFKRGWSWYYRHAGYALVILGAVVLIT